MMETIVYTFCAHLPIHLLAYLPFLDLLRFRKRWVAATVAGNLAIHLLGVAWAIVSHYAALCREQSVEADIRLMVPAKTKQVTDLELCVLFGNLLKNALEACARMTEGRKFLRLSSAVHLGTLTMDNSFDGRVRQEDGRFYSSKRGGDARFEQDGRLFRSSVYVRV